jgi:LytS/YehU family sensor histidine kinase
LILPLVENSFKHGVSNDVGNSWIRVDLTVKDDWLTVKIENSRVADSLNGHALYKGIGMENVKKRLEIIYPDRHEFKCMSEGQSFLTILKIKKS